MSSKCKADVRDIEAGANVKKELQEIEQRSKMVFEKIKSGHKCGNCVWGKWQDSVHFCLFPKCIKGKVK